MRFLIPLMLVACAAESSNESYDAAQDWVDQRFYEHGDSEITCTPASFQGDLCVVNLYFADSNPVLTYVLQCTDTCKSLESW